MRTCTNSSEEPLDPDRRDRNFVFTLHKYKNRHQKLIQKIKCRYLIYGREVGSKTESPHLQGFISYANARSLNAVHKDFPKKTWIKPAIASANANFKYCSKDQDYFEKGKRPQQGKRSDLLNFVESVKESDTPLARDELFTTHANVYARFPRFVQEVQAHYHPPSHLPELLNYWLVGPPGSGKSRLARTTHPKAYIKNINKWWDHYAYHDHVIIEEMEPSHRFMSTFLKIWADHYPFQAEVKNGCMLIRPKRIIITSNYTIEDIFCGDEPLIEAINRRFTVLEIGTL